MPLIVFLQYTFSLYIKCTTQNTYAYVHTCTYIFNPWVHNDIITSCISGFSNKFIGFDYKFTDLNAVLPEKLVELKIFHYCITVTSTVTCIPDVSTSYTVSTSYCRWFRANRSGCHWQHHVSGPHVMM